MKAFLILHCILLVSAGGLQAFTEPPAVIYGKVFQLGGGSSAQLFNGQLDLVLGDESDLAQRLQVSTRLRPSGANGAYSYALEIPQKYLPRVHEQNHVLSVRGADTRYRMRSLKIDGNDAFPADATQSLLRTSFSRRANEHRLDLLVSVSREDRDGDGMPDWWETEHGLNPGDANDAGLDPDGDGLTNFDELRAGGDPNVGNEAPELALRKLHIPELGRAGMMVSVIDSNSPATAINFQLQSVSAGFELRQNGAALSAGASFSLADLQGASPVTVEHVDLAMTSGTLGLQYSDGVAPAQVALLPLEVTTPVDASFWLDAKALGLADGAAIPEWSDRSGQGHHAWQAEVGKQPLYVASSGGQPAVTFGNDRHLFLPDATLTEDAVTAFVLYDAPSSLSGAESLLASNRLGLTIANSGTQTFQFDTGTIDGVANVAGEQILTYATFGESGRYAFTHDAFEGAGYRGLPPNPVQSALGAHRSAFAGNAITQPFTGKLRELLLFPRALSESEQIRTADYLASKWLGAVVWDWASDAQAVVAEGGVERDRMRGGWGNDQLGGGANNDILSGGPGNDQLSGGSGRDTFVYHRGDQGTDRILDFDGAEDIIDLSALFMGVSGDPAALVSTQVGSSRQGNVVVTETTLKVAEPVGVEIVIANVAISKAGLSTLIESGAIRLGAIEENQTLPEVSIETIETFAQRNGQIPASIRLKRNGSLDKAMSVDLQFSGEAVLGRDYESVSPVVMFAVGSDTAVVEIKPTSLGRGHTAAQSVVVSIASNAAAYQRSGSGQATVYLIDAKVGPLLTYNVWQANAFPGGATEAQKEPLADYDSDGAANLIEYVMGTLVSDPQSPALGIIPIETYTHEGFFHVRFKTVPDIIDAKINLVAFKNFATPVVVDEDFDIVQKPLTNGTIERVYRSKTPNSGLSGATIYSIRATLKSGLDPLTQ